jgi:hypothetical protein
LPYNKVEATQSIEVTEVVPPIPWWLIALIAGFGGIALIGGVIYYEEVRKRGG